MFDPTDRDDNSVSFRLHRVKMSLIKIEHDARDQGTDAVLPGAHAAHSVRMDRNNLDLVAAGSLRKIKQNPLGIGGRLNRGFNWRTQCNFYLQVGSVA
jgi:hypothetical protein